MIESMNEKVQDWGDFVNRYTSHSSRHSSPERELDYGDMRLTPSPISSVFSTTEKLFCRRDNIDQCIAYLNQVRTRVILLFDKLTYLLLSIRCLFLMIAFIARLEALGMILN